MFYNVGIVNGVTIFVNTLSGMPEGGSPQRDIGSKISRQMPGRNSPRKILPARGGSSLVPPFEMSQSNDRIHRSALEFDSRTYLDDTHPRGCLADPKGVACPRRRGRPASPPGRRRVPQLLAKPAKQDRFT